MGGLSLRRRRRWRRWGCLADNGDPSLLPEIGPDGLYHEAPVIAYTEKLTDYRAGTTSIEEKLGITAVPITLRVTGENTTRTSGPG